MFLSCGIRSPATGHRIVQSNTSVNFEYPPLRKRHQAGGKVPAFGYNLYDPHETTTRGTWMITLYTSATPNGHKASIMIEELGLAYEVRTISLADGQHLTPDYLKVSPAGKIPALVLADAGGSPRRLFGSAAILQYLAETHGRLLPTDPAQRIEALGWLSIATSDLGPAAVSLFRFAALAPEKLPYAIDLFKGETGRCWRAIDTRLAGSPHLAGPDYSIADIAVFPFAAAAAKARPDFLDARPNIGRWYDAIAARPAVQRGMAVPG